MKISEITSLAEAATRSLNRGNSEAALQAVVELLLTDHSPDEVKQLLRAWADYLDERV